MPKQKPITITFIISGGKGQSIEVYPNEKLNQLKNKIAKKLMLPKDKVIIFTYKNKDLFEDQQTLADLQINDKSIVYVRLVQKINLQTSHKLGQTKMKKSAQIKKQSTNFQSIQANTVSSKELIEKIQFQPKQANQTHKNQKIQQQKINIFIQVQDKKYSFIVSPQSNINQVKALVCKKLNLPVQKNLLLKNNQVELQNISTLQDSQIKQNQVLTCKFVSQENKSYSQINLANEKQNKQIHLKINSQDFKNFGQQTQKDFLGVKVVESQQFRGGQEWFQNKKHQNIFLNKFSGFLNCDLKKSQIIDDDQQYTAGQQNQQYKSPLTPQYANNSKNFSTPYTPSFDINSNNRKTFSLFQKSQVTSKIWNGQIIETERVAFIQEDQNFLFQDQLRTCSLYCSDNVCKQYLFECNNQVKVQDIKKTLAKLEKTDQRNIQIKLQNQILEQLDQQNFLVVDYWTVSKAKQLNWIYTTFDKYQQQK